MSTSKQTKVLALTFRTIPPDLVPMDLLLDADPSETNIKKYLNKASCYVAENTDKVVGVCVLNTSTSGTTEIFNIAVSADAQAKGVGTALLQHVITESKWQGIKHIELGTGTFGYQLTFYQRAGFRVDSIDKDFFLINYDEPIFESGIQHKDMLRLVLEL